MKKCEVRFENRRRAAPIYEQAEHIYWNASDRLEDIRHVLRRTGGKVGGRCGAAELLEMKPSTLRWRMKKLEIPSRRGEGNHAIS